MATAKATKKTTKQEAKQPEPRLGDPIPEQWLKEAEALSKLKYKSITLGKYRDGENVEVHIHHPTTGEEGIIQDAYAKAFSRLITDDDLLTRDQMEEVLKKKGIWGKDKDDKLESLQDDLLDIELTVAKLRKKGAKDNAISQYRDKWESIRTEISTMITKKNTLLRNTVEGRAEEVELRTKLSLCVRYPNGQPVWESIQAFDGEPDRKAISTIVGEAMLFWAGLSQEIIDSLPSRFDSGGEKELES